MHKTKKFLISSCIFITLFAIVFIVWNSSRTKYNDENAMGNLTGNLFNEGLFCEQNGKIYFSNPNDNGTLYRMNSDLSNYKKLQDDKVAYINVIGPYLYYVRQNNEKETNSSEVISFNNVGIYRMTLKNKTLKMLYDNPSGLMNVHGNSVYYMHYNNEDGLTFYSVGIDGLNETKISEEAIMPISIIDNTLYYSGVNKDHNIYAMNIKSGDKTTLLEDNCYAPIVNTEYIYYMSVSDNYKIYRANLDGSNPSLLVDERCSTYNITNDGKYLYYQVDDASNNRIAFMNLQTGETLDIQPGNYKSINIAGDYVFFTDFSESEEYYVTIGLNEPVNFFNPPNLSK